MQVSIPLTGRDDILARLGQRLEALKQGYRQNVCLVGPRHIGKTFLLREFLARLEKDSEILPVYVLLKESDFDGFLERWLGSLLQGLLASRGIPLPEEFQQLLRVSREHAPKTLDGMREVKRHAFQKKTTLAFRELLGLTSTLREETGKKILLVIDEFPQIESLEITDPFGLFGKEMMIQKDTFYLVTSSEPHRTREIFSDRLSLLFGNFEIIEVGPLGLNETHSWAEQNFPELKIPAADFRLLSHLLDNRPYYFELFLEGARLAARGRGVQTWDREFLAEVFTQVLFSDRGLLNHHFELELQKLIRLGRLFRPAAKTLVAIAQGRAKLFQIAAYLGKKGPEMQKVLQRLVAEGILEKKGSFYVLGDRLFRFWLRHVYQIKEREILLEKDRARLLFEERLRDEIRCVEEEERRDLTARLESLFREFRNDVVEVDRRRIKCPAFLELASRPTNGRYFPIQGRTSQGRWLCQVYRDTVTEGDVTSFSEELKRFRRGIQRKVMVALAGIELNAKLMAQEGKIQVWDLENLNALLDLYGRPKIIL